MRDYPLETTFDVKFTTRRFTSGAPFTLAGSPAVAAYPANGTTEVTAGITLTVDFDAQTGLNNVRVVATAANGYVSNTNYALVLTAGTVDSVSVVGEVVTDFSLEAQSHLRPTVVGRTLDVSVGGEAGLDWANVGSPTTALNLSGTNIDPDQVVASVSGSIASIASGGISSGSFAEGAINAAALATDAITAAKVATDAITEIQSGLATAAALATVDDFLDTEIGDILAAVDTEVAAVKTVTDTLTGLVATLQADTDNIQTRLATALTPEGNMKVDVLAVAGSIEAATALQRGTRGNVLGTVGVGSSTISIVTSGLDPAASAIDQFKGRVLTFTRDTTTVDLRGQATSIITNTAVGVLTVIVLSTAPISGDSFVIT